MYHPLAVFHEYGARYTPAASQQRLRGDGDPRTRATGPGPQAPARTCATASSGELPAPPPADAPARAASQAFPTTIEERNGKQYKVTRYGTIHLACGIAFAAVYLPFWLLYAAARACERCASGSQPGAPAASSSEPPLEPGDLFYGDTLLKLLDSGSLTPNSDTQQPGVTLLTAAASQGRLRAMALLLDRGADVNKKCGRGLDGATPLLMAVQHGRAEAVKLLLVRGADVNAVMDSTRRSSLFFAAYEAFDVGRPERLAILHMLLAHGADVNAASIPHEGKGGGATPLSMAATEGNATALVALLSAGARIDAQSVTGHTALMLAARNGNIACVKALLERGADWRCTNAEGRTARELCSSMPEAHSLLEQYAARAAAATPNPVYVPPLAEAV